MQPALSDELDFTVTC